MEYWLEMSRPHSNDIIIRSALRTSANLVHEFKLENLQKFQIRKKYEKTAFNKNAEHRSKGRSGFQN